MENILSEIKIKCPWMEILENEPMSLHCSFRIGGPVRAMIFPESIDDISGLCAILRSNGVKPMIVGKGTNLLVTDSPLNRIIIMTEKLCGIEKSDTQISAECGISLAKLAVFAQENGLAGLEFAHGIPGSLGGAVSMNAGAYGGEMKDVIVSVTFLDGELNLCAAETEDLNFSYRHSAFSDTDKFILKGVLRLTPDNPIYIRTRMEELMTKRRTSQPLDKPSAGSTFKRPASGYAAAMIDEAGLRGFSVGGAAVSEKHAGFVVNLGDASFCDIRKVMEHIQDTVYSKFGVRLEPEVKIVEN